MRFPSHCLLVLVGPSGSGKSFWAARNFRPEQVVSSDALRAAVGVGEHDQRAGSDAFEILEMIVDRRLGRRLFTVVDTTGLEPGRRAGYLQIARRHGAACHAVLFDTAADICRARNKLRARPVPAKILNAQISARDEAAGVIAGEGFDAVHVATDDAVIVPEDMVGSTEFAELQRAKPVNLEFGLQLSSFPAGEGFAGRLAEVAAVAEAVGFSSLWVMDHVVQIPQVGRPWEDMPESWTTLAWLAARTTRVRIGTLVTGVTLRNPAHLAKIVATVDVLSGGRAICGLGLAWWEWEHRLYGWDLPPARDRYILLEDTVQLLRAMWGPGSPPFKGRSIEVAETICYPRPLQDHIPILVGGSGEQRTLRLAARFADACNLFGNAEAVARKVSALNRHCEEVGREPAEIRVTHLSTALVARSRRELAAAVAAASGADRSPEHTATRLGAGTVEDHVGRFRELADAGVQTAIVALPNAFEPGALETFGEIITTFESARPKAAW